MVAIPQNPLFPVVVVAGLSAWCLWRRFRRGWLLTPVAGLHFQVLLFFGLGGLATVLFPTEGAFVAPATVARLIPMVFWPFILGYAVVCWFEWAVSCHPGRKEPALRAEARFNGETLLILATISFSGQVFSGYLGTAGLRVLPSYLLAFFYPSLLLANLEAFSVRGESRKFVVFLSGLAGYLAFFSPWRSMLVLVLVTSVLAAVLRRPRLLWPCVGGGWLLLSFLIPFLNFKKANYDTFRANPMHALLYAMPLEPGDRLTLPLKFAGERLSYAKELVYVQNALTMGLLEPLHGSSYRDALMQLVPRVIWPAKPELAFNAGFNVPRAIGLLHESDPYTSAAVNMFGEAAYNFGIWHLVWFVPLVFGLLESLGRFVEHTFESPKAQVLVNTTLSFSFLNGSTLVFLGSTTVATLVLAKGMESTFLRIQTLWWRRGQRLRPFVRGFPLRSSPPRRRHRPGFTDRRARLGFPSLSAPAGPPVHRAAGRHPGGSAQVVGASGCPEDEGLHLR